jgi:phosphotransferase system enzyme I (PtsP)
MRPASIGPVKSLLMRVDLGELRKIISDARHRGDQTVRPAVMQYLRGL